MRLPHWAQLLLGLATVILTWVMNSQASGALVLPAAAVTAVTILKTVVGLLSDSVGKATVSGVAKVGGAVLLLAAGSSTLEACFTKASVLPSETFAACVAADAVSGASIPKIVEDCGGDAAAVIASLFQSKSPDVTSSKAYAEALAARAVLMSSPDAGSTAHP